MARIRAQDKIQPHWWGKSLTSVFLGLTLSYALIGLFAWYGPGGIDADVKVQFNMWMISPIWLSIIAFSFMFKTAGQAIRVLLLANIAAIALFLLLRWAI